MKSTTCAATAAVILLAAASPVRAQYFDAEQRLAVRAAEIRWEAQNLQERGRTAQQRNQNLQAWKSEVDDWARCTEEHAQRLREQARSVDRAAFFQRQAAAVNQANADDLRRQGQAIYASAQQVALRTEQLRTYERQLWQWKAVLDAAEARLRAGVTEKNDAHLERTADMKADNERLARLLQEQQKQRDALAERRRHVEAAEKEAAIREKNIAALLDERDGVTTALDKSRAAMDREAEILDRIEAGLDKRLATLKEREAAAPRSVTPKSEGSR